MEGFACLEKKEKLALYTDDGKLKELILKDVYPFPGYYQDIPMISYRNKLKYIFVALGINDGCYDDLVFRAACKLKRSLNYDFEVSYGSFSVLNRYLPCIRIELDDLSNTNDLLTKLRREGLKFEKVIDLKPYESRIKIKKYLSLSDYLPDIYKSSQEDFYYLAVPYKLDWNDFTKMIISIRGTRKFKDFDAAQISLYERDDIKEFIRIYTRVFEKKDFILFHKQVMNYIKKFQ